MSTLSDLLAEHTQLSGGAVAHLQRLVSEWQLLSDLAFSDLTLWVQLAPDTVVCVAQVRPTTSGTVHSDDLVGRSASGDHASPMLATLAAPGGDLPMQVSLGEGIRSTVMPVLFGEVVVAALARDDLAAEGAGPSALETAYTDAAESLLGMVGEGAFPTPEQPGEMHTGPRAGDGLLRLNPDGTVDYVSPNALSAYHRLGYSGDLVGAPLAGLTRGLIGDPFDAAELAGRITDAVHGRPSLRMEVEARGATVLFRSLPLLIGGAPSGALVLVRDVTEVRRRDRALLSKDATIREIHHRVKNNLQTVAALLRLQARRSTDSAVRQALSESMRRVASIALVHEVLSTAPDDRLDLDAVVDRLVPILVDVAAVDGSARIKRAGSFGSVSAELATPLVMVLAEVAQNALQHGVAAPSIPGEEPAPRVTVNLEVGRSARELVVTVIDDGQGLPPGFSLERSHGLGLQIVRTLVDAELGGSIGMGGRPDGVAGTQVRIVVPLGRR